MPERWRSIESAPGYEVSDEGRIRSWRGRWGTLAEPVIRVPFAHPRSGHLQVQMQVEGRARNIYIHRAVLEAFVGPCPPGQESCHRDGDPMNNHLINLRWDTRLANRADRTAHGRNSNGVRNGRARLTEIQVHEIRRRYETDGHHVRALAKEFGVSRATVHRIATHTSWRS